MEVQAVDELDVAHPGLTSVAAYEHLPEDCRLAGSRIAGRDPAQLDITVMVGVTLESPCADLIKQYEDAGAQRVVLVLGKEAATPQQAVANPVFLLPEEAEATLDRLAEKSIERVG